MSSRLILYPKRFLLRCCIFGILLCLLVPFPFLVAVESETEAESSEVEYRSKIGIFGGNTQDGHENGASFGVEYVYRMGNLLSIGGFAEYAGGDFDLWLLGLPLFIHPHAGWFFRLAPAAEIEHNEVRFVFSTSVGYDFEITPRWALAPEVSVDLNLREREFTQVYGVSLLYSF